MYIGTKETFSVWLKTYLNDQQQITKMNNTFSNPVNSEYGVPHGSILCPLLFLIYINDIDSHHT